MPTKVYNNVDGHKLLDGSKVIEDVTSVALPTISHPTTSMSNISGMVMDVDMPDKTHLEAMEFGVSHNNGVNCQYLSTPGKHSMEFRIARQRYDVEKADITHEGMKIRVIGQHKSSEKGTIETGNPYGTTDKYSVIRYEEERNGKLITLIDAAAGILRFNGKDYGDPVAKLLD